jgi:zinc protease
VQRFQNQAETDVLGRLERVGGFGGKADQLNQYYFYTGNPDYFEEDLARFRAVSPSEVRAVAQRYLGPGRVLLSIVPSGKKELAVPVEGTR